MTRMGAFAIGCFALLAMPLAAQGDVVLRASEIEFAATGPLAERVLGLPRAADVERFRAESAPVAGGLGTILFFHRPTRSAPGFCRRILDRAWLRREAIPTTTDELREGPYRVASVQPVVQVAMARDCRRPDLQYATLQPWVTEENAITSLHNLDMAIRAARNGRRLPFALICRDTLPVGGCRDGGRGALARLDVRQVQLIHGENLVVGQPGQASWNVHVLAFGTPRASVFLVREVPAPF